jgi:amino acid transporter
MAFSALSAMNGSMLTGARVPFAVATDGLAPRPLARLSSGARIPITAVLVQGALSCVYATGGGFDDLTVVPLQTQRLLRQTGLITLNDVEATYDNLFDIVVALDAS